MGLDMYMDATKRFYESEWYSGMPKNVLASDICKVMGVELVPDTDATSIDVSQRVGYWRKHNALHTYIVEQCAGGVDECQEIWLDEDRLKQLREAVEGDELNNGSGFFFGESPDINSEDEGEREYAEALKKDSLATIAKALEFQGKGFEITYRASW